MGLTNPDADRHSRHTMVLVPRDAPGVKVERMLTTMGYYDEPLGHGEVSFDNVRVPVGNILLGEGRAFEIAQGRLGPGRVHHCMRAIGLAEKALELACRPGADRIAFGKPLANLGGNRERIADARIAINRSRLLVLHAAWLLDQGLSPEAISAVSEIKVEVPQDGPRRHRHGDPDPRRRRHDRRLPARGGVRRRPLAAARRRSGRGAPQRDRQDRAGQVGARSQG